MKRAYFVKNLDQEYILLLFKHILVFSPRSMEYTKIKSSIICSNPAFLTKSIR